jgi:hypothetical protein
MPTCVSVRNNRGAWDGVNVAALIRAFTTYGPILEMQVFDRGYRASILFTNHADALAFVEEMTFAPHGTLFIPGIPYLQRLGTESHPSPQLVNFLNFNSIFSSNHAYVGGHSEQSS